MLSFPCEKLYVLRTVMLSLKPTNKPLHLCCAKFYWFILILVSLLLEIWGYLTKLAYQYFLQKKSTICQCTLNVCTWAIGRIMLSMYTKKSWFQHCILTWIHHITAQFSWILPLFPMLEMFFKIFKKNHHWILTENSFL